MPEHGLAALCTVLSERAAPMTETEQSTGEERQRWIEGMPQAGFHLLESWKGPSGYETDIPSAAELGKREKRLHTHGFCLASLRVISPATASSRAMDARRNNPPIATETTLSLLPMAFEFAHRLGCSRSSAHDLPAAAIEVTHRPQVRLHRTPQRPPGASTAR